MGPVTSDTFQVTVLVQGESGGQRSVWFGVGRVTMVAVRHVIPMAAKAQFSRFPVQYPAIAGRVGIMAGYAFPLGKGRMLNGLVPLFESRLRDARRSSGEVM